MSERKAFDVGYRLAIKHVIQEVELLISHGTELSELSAELRRFYATDLKKEGMTAQSQANVQRTT